LLNGKLSLHDIKDVEALCQDIANRAGLELQYHQRESLLTYLIEECWRLSGRYEEGRGSTTSFAGWATTNLRLRVTDWARIEFGRTTWAFKDRTYERAQPIVLSLDIDTNRPHGRPGLGSSDRNQLVDTTPHRSTDLMRVLSEGTSPDVRGDGSNGRAVDGRTTGRA
jgi:hypothetical protein